MKIFFVLISFVIFCYQCESVEVECEYKDEASCDYCLGYYCDSQNLELVTSKSDREITSVKVKGQHLSGKSDDDVTGFYAGNKVVKFFPRGLTKSFKKIENFYIHSSELQEVTKEDLKEFGRNLKKLWIYENEIEIIAEDLFKFNPNLEFVDLDGNKIKHIGDGVFNGLSQLKYLSLHLNPCTTAADQAANDHSKVLALIEKVQPKCKNWSIVSSTTQMQKLSTLEEQISSLAKFIESQNLKQREEMLNLKAEILTNVESKLNEISLKLDTKFNEQSLKFNEKCNLAPLNEEILTLGSKVEDYCKVKEPETSA